MIRSFHDMPEFKGLSKQQRKRIWRKAFAIGLLSYPFRTFIVISVPMAIVFGVGFFLLAEYQDRFLLFLVALMTVIALVSGLYQGFVVNPYIIAMSRPHIKSIIESETGDS